VCQKNGSGGPPAWRARLNANLDLRVVVGEHGYWPGCTWLSAAGYDPFGPTSASFNLVIGTDVRDPVSDTPSLRPQLCEIRPLAPEEASRTAGARVDIQGRTGHCRTPNYYSYHCDGRSRAEGIRTITLAGGGSLQGESLPLATATAAVARPYDEGEPLDSRLPGTLYGHRRRLRKVE
jgi:hypothetical protein